MVLSLAGKEQVKGVKMCDPLLLRCNRFSQSETLFIKKRTGEQMLT